MVNLLHTSGDDGDFFPIDFRVYAPETDGKTKNEHFLEMLVRARSDKRLKANTVLFDSWYASGDNLKMIHRLGMVFVTTLKSNRLVSTSKEQYQASKEQYQARRQQDKPKGGKTKGYIRLDALEWNADSLRHGQLIKLQEMPFIREASLALALLTIAGMAAPALAGGNPLYIESSNGQFGVLNPTTGAYTLIGTTSELIGGLGFAANGQLYGLGQDGTGSLFAINTTTAALTFIGNTGVPTAGSAGYGFGATSDGTLYADSNGKSYQINPATGAATTLGSLGFTSNGGLNGDDKGNLYLTGGSQSQGLYQVNRTTGQGTLIGTSTYGTVYGLADTGGTLYAVNTTGSVFSVNTATAAGTLTATYNVATVGSVYAAAAQLSPAPVPEASTTISLGLLLMLGLGGVVMSARRRKASSTL